MSGINHISEKFLPEGGMIRRDKVFLLSFEAEDNFNLFLV
jgi:hypothetical protein